MLRKGIRTKLDATSSTAEALRDALGLESEGEGEGKGEEMDKKAAKRWAAPLSSTVVSLELAKHMVQVRVHERPFEVEATPEAVKAIIAFCRQRLQDDPIILKRGNAQKRGTSSPAPAVASPPGPASGPDVDSASASASRSGFCLAAESCPTFTGKITWHPSVKAWSAHYKGENGKTLQKRFVVRAPPHSRSFLDHTAGDNEGQGWAAARRAAYEAAVRFWNEADRSKRDRLELAESGP